MKVDLLEEQQEAAASFRMPMSVTRLRKYRNAAYYICPRCSISIEREFMAYCDRCGQCLCWKNYRKAREIEKCPSILE